MTNRKRVLQRWPNAVIDRDGWVPKFGFFDVGVFSNSESNIIRGHGDTPAQAWADAAKKIRRVDSRSAK